MAGESLTLTCSASKPNEVRAAANLFWLSPDGQTVQEEGSNEMFIGELQSNSTTSVLLLVFPSLRTSTAGRYVCMADLSSPALAVPLVETAIRIVRIQSELLLILVYEIYEVIC